MRIFIISNNDGLLAYLVIYTCKSAIGIVVRDFISINNIKALLKIYFGIKGFFSCLIAL